MGAHLDLTVHSGQMRSNSVLVLNAGSSSLKFAIYTGDQLVLSGVENVDKGYREAVDATLAKVAM